MNATETQDAAYTAVDDETSQQESKKAQGAQAMRIACDLVLAQDALDIAQSMGKSSLEGHVMSARFLFEHAVELENQGKPEEASRVRSIIEKLYEESMALDREEAEREDEEARNKQAAIDRGYSIN